MLIDTDNMISISEANQNFSKVAKLTDEKGSVVILKNNAPRYVLLPYSIIEEEKAAGHATVMEAARKVILRNLPAYKELADR